MGLHSGIAQYNSSWPEGSGCTKCLDGYTSGYTWQTNEVSQAVDTGYRIVSLVTRPVTHFMCTGDTSVQGLRTRLHSQKLKDWCFSKGKTGGKVCYRTPMYAQVRNVDTGIWDELNASSNVEVMKALLLASRQGGKVHKSACPVCADVIAIDCTLLACAMYCYRLLLCRTHYSRPGNLWSKGWWLRGTRSVGQSRTLRDRWGLKG